MCKTLLAVWAAGAIVFTLAKFGHIPAWALSIGFVATLWPTIILAHGWIDHRERKRWTKTR